MTVGIRWLGLFATMFGAACTGGAPVRLEVVRDTLTLHGSEPAPFPLRALSSRGDVTSWRASEVRIATDSALTIHDGALVCLRDGRADVTVRGDGLRASFHVRCRLAESFASMPRRTLMLGEAPPLYRVHAKLAQGRVVPVDVRSFRVEDPRVVTVQGGRLVARGVGTSRIWIDVGGKELTDWVQVLERIVDDTVALGAGEFRSWRLPTGRYSVVAKEVGRMDERQWLYVSTEGARCVRDSSDEDGIYCYVGKQGGLGVRNVGPAPESDGRRLAVAIYRRP